MGGSVAVVVASGVGELSGVAISVAVGSACGWVVKSVSVELLRRYWQLRCQPPHVPG